MFKTTDGILCQIMCSKMPVPSTSGLSMLLVFDNRAPTFCAYLGRSQTIAGNGLCVYVVHAFVMSDVHYCNSLLAQ